MGLALEGETFSASVGVLIKSNARLQISLCFLGAMHGRQQPCPPSIRLLQTLAAPICGAECLCKSRDGFFLVTQALLRQAQAIVTNTEVRLGRDTSRKCADRLGERALLEIRQADISPGILRGSIQDILRQRAQDIERFGVLFAVDERDPERVASLTEIRLQLQRITGVPLGLFEATSIGTLPAEIEVDERRQMCSVGVLVIDFDGREHVVERFAGLPTVEPEIASQVVFSQASTLVIAHSPGRLGGGAARAHDGQGEHGDDAAARKRRDSAGSADMTRPCRRWQCCRSRFRLPKL
jgi:hypothetical protein